MAVTRPGTQTIIWVHEWEDEWPEPGDHLRTDEGGCYRIEKVRGAEFGQAAIGSFVVIRLEKDAVRAGAPGVHRWNFAPRVRTVLPSKRQRRRDGR